jgi:hypothetical protein
MKSLYEKLKKIAQLKLFHVFERRPPKDHCALRDFFFFPCFEMSAAGNSRSCDLHNFISNFKLISIIITAKLNSIKLDKMKFRSKEKTSTNNATMAEFYRIII